jgi:AAA-like domain
LTPVLLTRSISATGIETTRASDPRLLEEVGDLGDLSNKLSEGQRRRLEQERTGLESQYNLSIERLKPLIHTCIIETDPLTKFKLEKQIEQAESEIELTKLKLESIEEKLNSSLNDPIAEPESLLKNSDIKPANPIEYILEEPEGLVGLDSPFYIERPPVEGRCYEAIANKGALIRIKAPQQMGKSSLMIRILDRADRLGYQKVHINFERPDRSLFGDLNKLLRWFCASIGQQLGLPKKFDEYWDDDIFTSKDNCTTYLQSYLLKTIVSPVALTLDKVDIFFEYPAIATEFFGLLRVWHEAAKHELIWENLRLILVYSQEVSCAININQSPFNVGVAIGLTDFDRLHVKNLAAMHGLIWNNGELEELMTMVGGHPYLVRVALYQIARKYVSLRQLLDKAPTESGVYSDHLRRHLDRLKNNNLLVAMQQVVATEKPVRLPDAESFKLDSMGLISRHGNDVMPSCNLYRLYFRDRLGSI